MDKKQISGLRKLVPAMSFTDGVPEHGILVRSQVYMVSHDGYEKYREDIMNRCNAIDKWFSLFTALLKNDIFRINKVCNR